MSQNRRWQNRGEFILLQLQFKLFKTETFLDQKTAAFGASQTSQSTACIQHSAQIPRDRPNVSTRPAGDRQIQFRKIPRSPIQDFQSKNFNISSSNGHSFAFSS